MDRLTIYTGMNSFLLIDAVTRVTDDTIAGACFFSNDPVFLGMESLAQLAAMHVRYRTDFQKHAFLLKITCCQLPDEDILNGGYHMTGTLTSQSSRSFAYTLHAYSESCDDFKGEFLIATVDYNNNFKRAVLNDHYKKLFSCLQNASKID